MAWMLGKGTFVLSSVNSRTTSSRHSHAPTVVISTGVVSLASAGALHCCFCILTFDALGACHLAGRYLHALPTEARKTNGVACSLVTGASAAARTLTVDPLATASATTTAPTQTTAPVITTKPVTRRSESKISRAGASPRPAGAAGSPNAVSTSSNSTPTNGSPTATTLPAAARPPQQRQPPRLPLKATISPREGKRTAGTKTAM